MKTFEIPEQFETEQWRHAQIEKIDERILQLRAVPYGVETELAHGLVESFEPGAFSKHQKDPARVKLFLGHNEAAPPVGHAILVEDRADGVHISAQVSQTVAGNDLYELVRDGTLDEASIEFMPIPEAMDISQSDGITFVRHRRARLLGVALVPHGAYGRNALVQSVRDVRRQQREKVRADALARLAALNH